MLLAIGAHPYGALVLGSQGLYVLATRGRAPPGDPRLRGRVRPGDPALEEQPRARRPLRRRRRRRTAAERSARPARCSTTSGASPATPRPATPACSSLVLLLALVGLPCLARDRPKSALLVACVVLTPTLFFLAGRFGGNSAPESRHLIFVLPFLALATGAGIVAATRATGPRGAWLAALVVAALLPVEVAWGWHKTPALFKRENPVRVHARARGRRLARRDVPPRRRPLRLRAALPRRLGARRLGRLAHRRPPRRPEARSQALEEATKPLGRGVWVFDAGDNNNYVKRTRSSYGCRSRAASSRAASTARTSSSARARRRARSPATSTTRARRS